jgi:hypothetical protein
MIDGFLAAITLLVGFIFGVLKRILVFAFHAMSRSFDRVCHAARMTCVGWSGLDDLHRCESCIASRQNLRC